MTLVFDAANVRFDSYWGLLLPAATLAVMVVVLLRGGPRKWVFIMGGVTVLLFLVAFVLPVADFHHAKAALTDGSAKTVEGVISMHERKTVKTWTGSGGGVGISTYNRYRSDTSEQFYVGNQWFWLRVGGMPSGASFTNAGEPPVVLRDGMRARVTWFEDPWNGDETRILKLEIDEKSAATAPVRPAVMASVAPVAVAASTAALPSDFAAFWKRFSAAAAAGDKAGVKALTRFPFLFAGTPLNADRFDSIWMGIFPAPLRSCFGTATPMKDGDAWTVGCGAYVYVFNKGSAGWQLTDFTADPEAEQ